MPADVVAQFKKKTGIDVEVTLSNNEEMISKLRATGGAGFDLAQPSQDRITGLQQEFGIYKPMDLTKIKTELFIPAMLDATKKNTMLAGKVYGLPHIWGTDGLVVNTQLASMADYPNLCKPDCKGNIKFCGDNKDQLLGGMRAGEVVGAMMWDTGGWKLNGEKPEIQFIAPKSGALG